MKNSSSTNVTLPEGLPIVITGSTGGIGKEIVRAVARLGLPMILPCRSENKFNTLGREIIDEFPHAELHYLPLDLNDSQSVDAVLASLAGKPLAGVINNAGIMCRRYSISPDGIETTLNVNYFNTARFSDALLPQIARGGAMVFTTSITRLLVPGHADAASVNRHTFGQLKTYALSKKLITDHALSLAPAAAARGVRINCCDPGVVDSGMIKMNRWYDPLADIFFRPLIRSPRRGAMPAVRALLSPLSARIFTLRRIHTR